MMSVFSWRSLQDKGDDNTLPYHRTRIQYWVIVFIATIRAVSVLGRSEPAAHQELDVVPEYSRHYAPW